MDERQELPDLIHSFLKAKETSQALWKAKIYPIVLELLMYKISNLYHVLYRIDVSEEKVRSVFSDSPLAEVAAERITDLIVERLLEKIEWRRKYTQE